MHTLPLASLRILIYFASILQSSYRGPIPARGTPELLFPQALSILSWKELSPVGVQVHTKVLPPPGLLLLLRHQKSKGAHRNQSHHQVSQWGATETSTPPVSICLFPCLEPSSFAIRKTFYIIHCGENGYPQSVFWYLREDSTEGLWMVELESYNPLSFKPVAKSNHVSSHIHLWGYMTKMDSSEWGCVLWREGCCSF